MSEYVLVAEEIQKIDELLSQNYQFKAVKEDLEGAYVTFVHGIHSTEQTLHIKMADARKYFSSKLAQQLSR
ncbi:hypothetical protein [Lysinibacillus sp. 54212]|uniref:hypothetical protein n=1 Tax=Lysinibacillus sp. 54212 TaxID=3119829 RepID=UPI002FC96EEA